MFPEKFIIDKKERKQKEGIDRFCLYLIFSLSKKKNTEEILVLANNYRSVRSTTTSERNKIETKEMFDQSENKD